MNISAHKGPLRTNRSRAIVMPRCSAFTLIELILVMVLLTVTIGLATPRLASFFRGRALDSEARRLLAFTRYAQERAVSEGLPMRLWVDSVDGRFGVEPNTTYEPQIRSTEVQIDTGIRLQVVEPNSRARTARSSGMPERRGKNSRLPAIEFLPDGAVEEGSLERILLTDSEEHAIALARSRNRLSYELTAQ